MNSSSTIIIVALLGAIALFSTTASAQPTVAPGGSNVSSNPPTEILEELVQKLLSVIEELTSQLNILGQLPVTVPGLDNLGGGVVSKIPIVGNSNILSNLPLKNLL